MLDNDTEHFIIFLSNPIERSFQCLHTSGTEILSVCSLLKEEQYVNCKISRVPESAAKNELKTSVGQ